MAKAQRQEGALHGDQQRNLLSAQEEESFGEDGRGLSARIRMIYGSATGALLAE